MSDCKECQGSATRPNGMPCEPCEQTGKCLHKNVTMRVGRDRYGFGMERIEPRTWVYKTCDDCEVVTEMREGGNGHWVAVMKGHDIAFPDGRVY